MMPRIVALSSISAALPCHSASQGVIGGQFWFGSSVWAVLGIPLWILVAHWLGFVS
jgi:hypothetical protein